MNRVTKYFPPGAIHMLDMQGHVLTEYLRFKNYSLTDDDTEFLNSRCPDWLWHICDISSNNSDHFYYDRWDPRCLLNGGYNFQGVSLGDVANRRYVQNVKDSYNLVKVLHAPQLSLEIVSDSDSRSFIRLIHPLSFNGCRQKVLVACVYKDIIDLPYISSGEIAIARQKINATFSARERAVTRILNHQVHACKAIYTGWKAELNDMLKRNTDDPVTTFFQGYGLPVGRQTPGKA